METLKKPFRTTIGGSALIEGIMMRGPEKTAIVVRGPEDLVIKEDNSKSIKDKYPVLGLPFVRGVVVFVESMKISLAALQFSAEAAPEAAGEPSKLDVWLQKNLGEKKTQQLVMSVAMVLAMALSVGLFIAIPTLLVGWLSMYVSMEYSRTVLESLVRLVIFFVYLALVSRLPDMKRVFAYHGAEHKTIHCYEAGEELTVENVRKYPRQHPRCGTSFLLMVLIIGMLAFIWVTLPNPLMRMGLKLLMLPLVMAVSYEVNRLLGKSDAWLSRAIRAPGLWMQNLTTQEPDDSMIEVGIEALRRVIPQETGADTWR